MHGMPGAPCCEEVLVAVGGSTRYWNGAHTPACGPQLCRRSRLQAGVLAHASNTCAACDALLNRHTTGTCHWALAWPHPPTHAGICYSTASMPTTPLAPHPRPPVVGVVVIHAAVHRHHHPPGLLQHATVPQHAADGGRSHLGRALRHGAAHALHDVAHTPRGLAAADVELVLQDLWQAVQRGACEQPVHCSACSVETTQHEAWSTEPRPGPYAAAFLSRINGRKRQASTYNTSTASKACVTHAGRSIHPPAPCCSA